jgi:hypothetical protein
VIVLVWALLLAVILIISKVMRSLSALRLLRCVTIAFAVIWLARLAAVYVPIDKPLWWIVPLSVVTGVTSYVVFGHTNTWWLRTRESLIVGSLLFIVSGPLLGHLNSNNYQLLSPLPATDRLPTVWVLLDETSAGAADMLIKPLKNQGLAVSVTTAAPAGSNTLDIVPSLISRHFFGPDLGPCGWRMLCGVRSSLDMGRVNVGREDVDLIGTYHNWCSLRGWRSCVKDHNSYTPWSTQVHDLFCDLQISASQPNVKCTQRRIRGILEVREATLAAERRAPFWVEGGDLIVHILLPHLPANAEKQSSIEAAYEINLEHAANYLEDLAIRLRARFPHGFRLVAFSDHPLRPTTNCDKSQYGSCDRPIRYEEPYRVPVIVAAPDYVSLPNMTTNLNVFDLDLRPKTNYGKTTPE